MIFFFDAVALNIHENQMEMKMFETFEYEIV